MESSCYKYHKEASLQQEEEQAWLGLGHDESTTGEQRIHTSRNNGKGAMARVWWWQGCDGNKGVVAGSFSRLSLT
jgi:hypothetical protein